jgi:hypothetical protein
MLQWVHGLTTVVMVLGLRCLTSGNAASRTCLVGGCLLRRDHVCNTLYTNLGAVGAIPAHNDCASIQV